MEIKVVNSKGVHKVSGVDTLRLCDDGSGDIYSPYIRNSVKGSGFGLKYGDKLFINGKEIKLKEEDNEEDFAWAEELPKLASISSKLHSLIKDRDSLSWSQLSFLGVFIKEFKENPIVKFSGV